LNGAGLYACTVKYVPETNTHPAGISHRAIRPFATGDAGLKEAARIARALVDRSDLETRVREDVL
jgi:hypothetical protein